MAKTPNVTREAVLKAAKAIWDSLRGIDHKSVKLDAELKEQGVDFAFRPKITHKINTPSEQELIKRKVNRKADEAMRAILDRSDKMSKYGTSAVDVGENVKITIEALDREHQVSDEQLNRRLKSKL